MVIYVCMVICFYSHMCLHGHMYVLFFQVHGHDEQDRSRSGSPAHTALAFYTKVVLNSIHISASIKDGFIAQITTFLLKGLKSRNAEYKCSSYMILSAICSKVIHC